MKKILFITAFTPSKFSAGQNYTLHLLNDLSRDHQVDLVYFRYKDQQYVPAADRIRVIKEIRLSLLSRILNCLLSPIFHPFFTSRFSFFVLLYLIRVLKKNQYDLIYFDFSQVFLYSLFLKRDKKVMMCHDVIYQKFSREGNFLSNRWIRFTEGTILNDKSAQLLTFSRKDAEIIQNVYGKHARVVNFYLSPLIKAIDLPAIPQKDQFVFFGAWNRSENYSGLEWFIKEVAPFTPDEKYVIVGVNLPKKHIDMIAGYSNLTYLGYLENPYELIARSKALIAPIFKGAGVKVKVIESMACGTPVLGTHVALEGIDEVAENTLIECNTAAEFIDAITAFDITLSKKLALRDKFLVNYGSNQVNNIFDL